MLIFCMSILLAIIDARIVCMSNDIFLLFIDIFQSIFNIHNECISIIYYLFNDCSCVKVHVI